MVITSANKDMAITSATKRMAITTAICKTTIGQHQPIYRHNTCLVLKHLPQKPIQCPKIAGHTNTLTPSVLHRIKNNIFFRTEEVMLETGESFLGLKN